MKDLTSYLRPLFDSAWLQQSEYNSIDYANYLSIPNEYDQINSEMILGLSLRDFLEQDLRLAPQVQDVQLDYRTRVIFTHNDKQYDFKLSAVRRAVFHKIINFMFLKYFVQNYERLDLYWNPIEHLIIDNESTIPKMKVSTRNRFLCFNINRKVFNRILSNISEDDFRDFDYTKYGFLTRSSESYISLPRPRYPDFIQLHWIQNIFSQNYKKSPGTFESNYSNPNFVGSLLKKRFELLNHDEQQAILEILELEENVNA